MDLFGRPANLRLGARASFGLVASRAVVAPAAARARPLGPRAGKRQAKRQAQPQTQQAAWKTSTPNSFTSLGYPSSPGSSSVLSWRARSTGARRSQRTASRTPTLRPSQGIRVSTKSTVVKMTSSQSRNGERMIHQDFLARIRFSNTLPPPPVPPKLLDIPNTGLASGQYTNPGFASRLARDQPLNIEADAELGMPLDLVGMPGIFDGDESAIQAPAHAPAVHPHDRALLRPLATLGKPKVAETHVSFLRRTEYIATTIKPPSANIFLKPSSTSQASSNQPFRRPEKRKAASPEPDKGTPAYIKRKIEKSFDIAQANLKDRTRVKHPSNKSRLRCIDASPLLPDLDAFPDSGAYVTVKFTHNPVPSSSTYDTRLLSGIFKPITRSEAEEASYEAAQLAHERDPENHPRPNNMMNYEFYLPSDTNSAQSFRRRFDVDDPEHDSDSLYPKNSDCFKFKRVRAYETAQETELDHESKFSDELILAVNEENRPERERAVFYYPVMQRSTVRSQRTRNIARTLGGVQIDEDEFTVDQLDVTVDEPDEALKRHMAKYKDHPFGFEEEDDEQEHNEHDDHEEAGARLKTPVSEGERDADGEEDE